MIASFKELVRQPTGTHFLDSGGTYGRHWQQPPLPDRLVLIDKSEYKGELEFSARINLAAFLDATLEIDAEMTAILDRLQAEQDDGHWVATAAEILAEKLGWKVAVDGDNSYNHENDLSQEFQFAVITPDGEPDWLYAEHCLVLVQSHNGCDVRGGYSDIVVCKPKGYDGNYDFTEWTLGWRLTEGTDPDGDAISERDLETLGRKFEIGYSSNPTYRFQETIDKVLAVEGDHVTVKLKTGETVKAFPECRAEFI